MDARILSPFDAVYDELLSIPEGGVGATCIMVEDVLRRGDCFILKKKKQKASVFFRLLHNYVYTVLVLGVFSFCTDFHKEFNHLSAMHGFQNFIGRSCIIHKRIIFEGQSRSNGLCRPPAVICRHCTSLPELRLFVSY